MSARLVWFLLLTLPLAGQPQAVMLDFSGSMAGFANPGAGALPPVMERLGHILSARGSVAFYRMSSAEPSAPLEPLGMGQATARLRERASFRGNTPLLAALDRVIRHYGAQDIVLLTDGMEDGGRIEKVAAELCRLVREGWAIGLMAMPTAFQGRYYPEEKIPVGSFLPRIRQAVRSRANNWVVREDKQGCRGVACYYFEGERPLLYLLLSRSGSLPNLGQALARALREHYLEPAGALQLAPARASVSAVAEAPKATLVRLKLPSEPANNFECAETGSGVLAVNVRLRPNGASFLPQPSALRVTKFELLERPGWVQSVASEVKPQPDGTLLHEWRLICQPGRFWQQTTVLRGRLRIRYHLALSSADRGWWTELSAENSWEFPFKVYKLAELVSAVYAQALGGLRMEPVEVNYGMMVHN